MHEIKLDGYRIQGSIQNGLAHFYTRNAKDWGRHFPHLLNSLERIPVKNAIFDGEVVALDQEGKSQFQMLQNAFDNKNDSILKYYIFDLLYLNGVDLRDLPLIERKEKLRHLLADAPKCLKFSDHVIGSGELFLETSCERELEGIVSKILDSPYQSGRSDLWVKSKCLMRQEFVIAGWTELKNEKSGIGALLLGVYDDEGLRYVGKVGTGFTKMKRRELREMLSKQEKKKSPFKNNSDQLQNVHWVKAKYICEVKFSNWTDKGVLRSPAFCGLRFDKNVNEVKMEKKQYRIKTEMTSPNKILFNVDRKTKKDVAQYYQEVSPFMLPHVKNRPLSLVRCPNGAQGECFYQKHFSHHIPSFFSIIKIKEKTGLENYISLHSTPGLMYLVQINAFEIHCSNADINNFEHPNQIVMDLDPGAGVTWDKIVDAGYELREMLLDLDLISFVKVTGGKGIHLHIPVAPVYGWEQIKSFAEVLALHMTEIHPEFYVSKMSKKNRNGKIFIDYFRNTRGATAVAPYSLRAKDKTAVALPLEWEELTDIKSADTFTMDEALKKIHKRTRDPWEDMAGLEQKIHILDEKVS